MNRILRSSLLGAAVLALAPAAAGADSLFYVKGNDVYASNTDGSGAVQLTSGGVSKWPSQADDGTWERVGNNDGDIYRYSAGGALLNSMTTYGSYSVAPDNARISPDGTKIAFRVSNAGDYSVYAVPATATDTSGTNGQGLGQQSYGSPSWIGSTDLFLVHNGSLLPGQEQFDTYHVGDPQNSYHLVPSDDPDQGTRTSFSAAISRNGARAASIESDDSGSTELQLFTTNGGVPTTATYRCSVPLPAGTDVFQSTPSFSPDGTKLAFSLNDGVHVISLGDLSTCPAAGAVVIPGASEVFWGAAAVPVPQQAGGGGGGGGGGGDTTAPVGSFRAVGVPKIKVALAKGIAFSAGCDEACSWRVDAAIDAKTAKKVGLLAKKSKAKILVVGSGSLGSATGARVLKLRFTSKAKKKLASLKTFKLAYAATATDKSGNSSDVSGKLTLKR